MLREAVVLDKMLLELAKWRKICMMCQGGVWASRALEEAFDEYMRIRELRLHCD